MRPTALVRFLLGIVDDEEGRGAAGRQSSRALGRTEPPTTSPIRLVNRCGERGGISRGAFASSSADSM